MFRVELDCETCQIVVNFGELMSEYEEYTQYEEYIGDWLDECYDIMSNLEEEFDNMSDNVNNPQDYYYIVNCTDENANDVEDWLYSKFSDLEDKINDEISELESDDDDEDEEFDEE